MPLFRLIAWTLIASSGLAASAATPAVTNCLDVIRLARDEANKNLPVHLIGTVTCYLPGSQLCFVQDATAGVYVLPSPWPRDLAEGDVVEVRGVTGAGRFSSIVQIATVAKTGRRATVPARRVAIEELNIGKFDCQRVELEGVVQSESPMSGVLSLSLWTGGSSATILVFTSEIPTAKFIDARARVRGVAGTFYDKDRLNGFGLFVHGMDDVEVLTPAGDPFAAPLRPISNPIWFSPEGRMDHRIRIRGLVSANWPGEALFIQDHSGAMRVSTLATNAFQPGDLVEASGFLRDIGGAGHLAAAVVRKIGTEKISIRPGTIADLQVGTGPSLMSLDGVVVRAQRNETQTLLTLEADGRLIAAYSPALLPVEKFQGARVRIVGVWSAPPAGWRNSSPGLWLRPGDAPTILAPPTPPVISTVPVARVLTPFVAGTTAGLAIVFAGLSWRSGTRARAKALEAAAVRLRLNEQEKELQQLNEARERLGRDLHDHTIQSIYAVGLKVDDCTQHLRDNPDRVENRLKSALSDINAVIRELRNVILGLETQAIQPKEFRTALKSLSLTLGQEKSNRIRLDIEQNAMEALSPLQATELIHIAREGLSNSLRHGQAETTTFILENLDQQIRFTIEDDGRGFDSGKSESKGFGLRNMAKRAENLGAIITISAELGKGTRIVLDIPRQKQHLSPL
jgi:two-component system NarL family sensor kinase